VLGLLTRFRIFGTCETLESGTCRLRNQELMMIGNQEPERLWNQEPVTIWNQESAKFGSLLKFKFRGYDVRGFSCMRDSGTKKKPSQRRYLKGPGLTCELVAGL
jgi:hypothetical protein